MSSYTARTPAGQVVKVEYELSALKKRIEGLQIDMAAATKAKDWSKSGKLATKLEKDEASLAEMHPSTPRASADSETHRFHKMASAEKQAKCQLWEDSQRSATTVRRIP